MYLKNISEIPRPINANARYLATNIYGTNTGFAGLPAQIRPSSPSSKAKKLITENKTGQK